MGIRVAIVGVGNCASALVQALEHYKNDNVGLMHEKIGGYRPSDIEIVGAIDVDARKVGKDLSEAIFMEPNVAQKMCEVSFLGVKVVKGPVLDGVDGILKDLITVSDVEPIDVEEYLKSVDAEILVNLLPTGARKATEFYAEAALKSRCAFVNCTPTSIASDENWSRRFEESKVPLAGDDLMSQIGGTAFHLGMIEFLKSRGVRVEKTYQLDIGGSMEAYGILEDHRREEKRNIKTSLIQSLLNERSQVTTGTSDFVEFMRDRRTSYFYIEGKYCLGSSVVVDVYLRTNDGPNGAGILLDVIRAMKLALDRGLHGTIIPISAYGFKNPPIKYPIAKAMRVFEEFIDAR